MSSNLEIFAVGMVINLVVACANFWTWIIAGVIVYKWVNETRNGDDATVKTGSFRVAKKPDGTYKLTPANTEEEERVTQAAEFERAEQQRERMNQFFYGGK